MVHHMSAVIRYAVIFGMLAVAVLGLPILFPYNQKPHADKSDSVKSSLVLEA